MEQIDVWILTAIKLVFLYLESFDIEEIEEK